MTTVRAGSQPPKNGANAKAFYKADKLIELAFELKDKGTVDHYNVVVRSIAAGQHLSRWFRMLSECVNKIKPTYTELLDAIFRFNWFKHDMDVVTAYTDFLFRLNMSPSGNHYLAVTVTQLVKTFMPRTCVDSQEISTEEMMEQVHTLLNNLLFHIPAAAQAVWTAVQETYPHKTFSGEVQRTFLTHVLWLTTYCPALKERLLLLAVDRLLHIDVEYKTDLEPVNEFDVRSGKTGDDELMFDMDNSQENMVPNPSAVRPRDLENEELASKLDGVLDLFFEYIMSRPANEQDSCMSILFKAFDKLILPTHRSHFVQYLLFVACSLKPHYADAFLEYLLSYTYTETNPPNLRYACASYIGSFVARAKYLSPVTVKRVVEQLMPWLHDYVDRFTNQTPDAARHGVFYYIFQSLALILLFRHKELTELDTNYIRKLELERLIHSSLNPVKMCGQQTMATEFIKMLRQYGVKVSNILQRNKKIVLPTKTAFGTDNIIHPFFPFEPYTLAVSSRFVKQHYNVWAKPPDTGYDTDGEMDLDESTNLGELDMDDEAQANSMLRMMDYGRRSGVELLGTSAGRTNSWSEKKGSLSGSFDAGQFMVEDQEAMDSSLSNSATSPPSRPPSFRSVGFGWPMR